MASQRWPAGEEAKNLRVLLLCKVIAAALGDKRASREAAEIWNHLIGKERPSQTQGVSKEQGKMMFGS